MEIRQKQLIESYQRVLRFLAEHPLQAPASYGQAQADLTAIEAELRSHTTDQVLGDGLSKAAVDVRKTLTRELRTRHLQPIAKIARARLRGSPGMDKAMTVPKAQMSTQALLAVARAFHEAAAPYAEVFVRYGRPADFLDQLAAASDRLQEVVLSRGTNVGTKIGARVGISEEVKRARAVVDMLDGVVRNAFAGDVVTLARWQTARRVRGVAGRPRAAKSGTGDETVTLPAPGQAAA